MAMNKIRVRLRGFDIELVDQAAKSIVAAVKKTNAKFSGPIPLPTKINKFTVLRAVNVNIKSREQFEMRTHKRLVDVIRPTEKTTAALDKLEIPAGVDVVMEVK